MLQFPERLFNNCFGVLPGANTTDVGNLLKTIAETENRRDNRQFSTILLQLDFRISDSPLYFNTHARNVTTWLVGYAKILLLGSFADRQTILLLVNKRERGKAWD